MKRYGRRRVGGTREPRRSKRDKEDLAGREKEKGISGEKAKTGLSERSEGRVGSRE